MTNSVLQANNAAAAQAAEDVANVMGLCPHMKKDIQLVPMRYAISEKDDQLDKKLNGSLYQDKAIPLGIRPLEAGWLYLIHSKTPDKLYEYEVKADQSLTPRTFSKGDADFKAEGKPQIIVPNTGSVKVMFTPLPLVPEAAEILLNASSDQSELMNRASLSSYDSDKGCKGLIPTDKVPDGIDFVAQVTDPADEHDNGIYTWLKHAILQQDAQPVIQSSVLPDYAKNSALLLVNDVCADIADLAEWQNRLKTQYKDHCDKEVSGHKNIERYEVGKLLEKMSTIDFYIEQDTKAILKQYGVSLDDKDEQSAFIDKVKSYYEALSEPKNRVTQKRTNYNGDTIYVTTNPAAEALEDTLVSDYDLNKDKLSPTTREVFGRYKTLIEGGYAGKDGIKTVIDNDGMTSFIDEWEAYGQEMTEKLNRLNALAKKTAPHWHMLAAYLSPQNPEQWDIKLTTEDILTAFFNHNDDDWLGQYYMGTDSFPLSVYDDLVKNEAQISFKDGASIRKKYQSIAKAQEAIGKFEDKIAKANEMGKLNQITDENIKARVLQSLALKNDRFVASLSKAMKTSGDKMNFHQRLAASLDNLSDGTKQLMHLNFVVNDIKWQLPDAGAAKTLQGLTEELHTLSLELKQTELLDHQLRTENNKILKINNKQKRSRARAAYNEKVRAADTEKKRLKAAYQTKFDEMMQHAGPEVSIGVSTAGAYPMSRLLGEANDLLGSWQGKKYLAGQTLREMFVQEGVYSPVKIAEHSASWVLTVTYLFSAWHAWEKYLDEEKDADLLVLLSSTATASASVLSLAGTYRSAWLAASAAVLGEKNYQQAVLGRLANWTIFSNTMASVLGTIGLGVKTVNAVEDAFHAWKQNFLLILSSSVRAVSYLGATIASGTESVVYMYQVAKVLRGATNVAITGSILDFAAILIRWQVLAWAVTLVFDKLWQYYRWPPVVDWASDTLWGENDQGWSLSQHYQQLSPSLVQPTLQTQAVNNHYHKGGSEESEIQLKLFLPQIQLPDAANCKLALNGFSPSSQSYGSSWHNLLPQLSREAIIIRKARGCEINLYVRSDMIALLGLDLLQLQVSISSDGENWHKSGWLINLLDLSTPPGAFPEMVEVMVSPAKHLRLAYPLTPWS